MKTFAWLRNRKSKFIQQFWWDLSLFRFSPDWSVCRVLRPYQGFLYWTESIQLTPSFRRIIGAIAISPELLIRNPLFPLCSTERLSPQMISCENSLKGNSRKLNKWETNKFSICLSHHLGITPEKVPFDPNRSINHGLISRTFCTASAKLARVSWGYLPSPATLLLQPFEYKSALFGWWLLLNLLFIEMQTPENPFRRNSGLRKSCFSQCIVNVPLRLVRLNLRSWTRGHLSISVFLSCAVSTRAIFEQSNSSEVFATKNSLKH